MPSDINVTTTSTIRYKAIIEYRKRRTYGYLYNIVTYNERLYRNEVECKISIIKLMYTQTYTGYRSRLLYKKIGQNFIQPVRGGIIINGTSIPMDSLTPIAPMTYLYNHDLNIHDMHTSMVICLDPEPKVISIGNNMFAVCTPEPANVTFPGWKCQDKNGITIPYSSCLNFKSIIIIMIMIMRIIIQLSIPMIQKPLH